MKNRPRLISHKYFSIITGLIKTPETRNFNSGKFHICSPGNLDRRYIFSYKLPVPLFSIDVRIVLLKSSLSLAFMI